MLLSRRRFLLQLVGVPALATVAGTVAAQVYPNRPLHLIVGFPTGGSSDIIARIMADWLSGRLGQAVIVENRPGTSAAFQGVAHAPLDGYTLLFFSTSTAINVTFYETGAANFLRDITPVAGVVRSPLVLVVHPSVPARSVTDFVAYAKANPGKINIGSFGVGTLSHLAIELFKTMTGVDIVHVPYRGGGPMITDLLGGQVHAAIDALPSSLPHVQSGSLRALAVTTKDRSEVLRDVPAVGESVQGFEASTSSGIGVPAGTPTQIIDRLNREVNAGLMDPTVRARLSDAGTTPLSFSPQEFSAHMAAEIEKWAAVIRRSGIPPR
jgi:tripartite-type tricarboxylate transporter receptor subunit TctC